LSNAVRVVARTRAELKVAIDFSNKPGLTCRQTKIGKVMNGRKRIGVIGAGIAGLTVAKAISNLSKVRIFEKSHGVGGRMATLWIDAVPFDHGAQYFTIMDARFHDALKTALATGIVEP
jgi:heterodisulfide reductase subunit A-like polyferredoxin